MSTHLQHSSPTQARVAESIGSARQRLIDMWRREEVGPEGGRAPTSSMRYVLKQAPAVRRAAS